MRPAPTDAAAFDAAVATLRLGMHEATTALALGGDAGAWDADEVAERVAVAVHVAPVPPAPGAPLALRFAGATDKEGSLDVERILLTLSPPEGGGAAQLRVNCDDAMACTNLLDVVKRAIAAP